MSPLDDYSMRVTGILYGPCREIREMDPAKSRGSAPPLIVRTRNRRERSETTVSRKRRFLVGRGRVIRQTVHLGRIEMRDAMFWVASCIEVQGCC